MSLLNRTLSNIRLQIEKSLKNSEVYSLKIVKQIFINILKNESRAVTNMWQKLFSIMSFVTCFKIIKTDDPSLTIKYLPEK